MWQAQAWNASSEDSRFCAGQAPMRHAPKRTRSDVLLRLPQTKKGRPVTSECKENQLFKVNEVKVLRCFKTLRPRLNLFFSWHSRFFPKRCVSEHATDLIRTVLLLRSSQHVRRCFVPPRKLSLKMQSSRNNDSTYASEFKSKLFNLKKRKENTQRTEQ